VPGEPVEFGSWTGVRYLILIDPDWLVADEGNAYVQAAEQVYVLDPETGAVRTTIVNASDGCQGIGAGLGGVWTCSGTDVIPLDPNSATTGAPISVNKTAQQGHLAVGSERLWVLTGDGSTLVGLEPETGDVIDQIALGARCIDVAIDDADLWVTCAADDVVLRIDGATLAVVDRLDVTEPQRVAFTDGAVWIGAAGSVSHLDPQTLEVVETIDGGTGRYGGLSANDAGVWVRRAAAPLVRIDPVTNEVTDELDLGVASGGDLLVAHGAVWTTAYDDQALFRIDLS
jgi:outer membrane protein assembly factor BamB